MKHFAKKRKPCCAVQWTGEVTAEMAELVGPRMIQVTQDRLLAFRNSKGPGRAASVGDWIVSTSGEDLAIVGDTEFREDYEEIDEIGRPLPTDEEHEAASQAFVRELDSLLVAGLKLSREEHATIFRERDRLIRTLSGLLADQSSTTARRERHRITNTLVDLLAKELRPGISNLRSTLSPVSWYVKPARRRATCSR
jgi:hypothetical protein